jgi:hypothetical protein
MFELKYTAALFLLLIIILVFGYILQFKKLTPYWKKVLIVSLLICLFLFALMMALILGAMLGYIHSATTLQTV